MAKSSKPTGTSRIKFIMFDAEIADDQIPMVTQAITNALRGPNPAPKRLPPAASQLNGNDAAEEHDEPDLFDALEEDETVDVTPAAQKKKVQRRVAPKPQVVNEVDVTSDPPLSSIGTFKSNHKRYLAIAAWLHDHRSIEVIDERHIYTCYRHLGWPTNINDFAQPLRELKHKQYFESPETGKYAINQLGLAKAKESSAT
ncbi:hypothetical protein [Bradyrhizobium sp. AUGA SZCCT0283]|uniref:hypothetical protein n=1 Tax=Bradyrhizobium sp. AUGA SZCCT0283 TaxID=2807671 RepID=UPI001BA5A324|nr:hypothetical protein [Bradyrhizobium sp. AUGA SZCCT0283]MBR1275605.1 hypothetical protein [Bradyrhizobium sp. AUGA SZCCT0283]